jgi:ankyrin repeat protein
MKRVLMLIFAGCFLQAACAGRQKAVSQNEVNPEGERLSVASTEYSIDAFSSAVLSNDVKLVSAMLKHSIDINRKDSKGHYPLESVLPFGNCEMAETLLAAGANPRLDTSSGESIYDLAMKTGNTTLKRIFSKQRK